MDLESLNVVELEANDQSNLNGGILYLGGWTDLAKYLVVSAAENWEDIRDGFVDGYYGR